MRKSYLIPYRESNHGDFNEEWLPHKKVSGWWYITGYLENIDNPKEIYSYQYTILRARVKIVTVIVMQLAITNFQTGEHLYSQTFKIREKKFYQDNVVKFSDEAVLIRNEKDMDLDINSAKFSLKLNLQNGKGAFWHGKNGVLVMGDLDDPKQRTCYYSYTNMPTTGELVFHNTNSGKSIKVKGKSWFDRQWGPYDITSYKTHWEWFSLRFFDEEEVMIFDFPQNHSGDGTYIDKLGNRHSIKNYTCKEKELFKVNDVTFSKGWSMTLPGIKEEKYEIIPIMDGQMNLAYFELLADIVNKKGEKVGYCFVELLPLVRDRYAKLRVSNLIKKVK